MGKKLKEFTFHSRELMPENISKLSLDQRVEWEENQRGKYRFKKGERLVHRDNLDTTLYVKEIIKELVMVDTGVTGEDDKPVMQRKKRMLGVRCYWWEQ
jgi:hypothetical protein